jgi:hypothetical protein
MGRLTRLTHLWCRVRPSLDALHTICRQSNPIQQARRELLLIQGLEPEDGQQQEQLLLGEQAQQLEKEQGTYELFSQPQQDVEVLTILREDQEAPSSGEDDSTPAAAKTCRQRAPLKGGAAAEGGDAAASSSNAQLQRRVAQAERVMAALKDDLERQVARNQQLEGLLAAATAKLQETAGQQGEAAEEAAEEEKAAVGVDAVVEAVPSVASLVCQTSEGALLLQPVSRSESAASSSLSAANNQQQLQLAEAHAAALAAQQELEQARQQLAEQRHAAAKAAVKLVIKVGSGGACTAGSACSHAARCVQLEQQLRGLQSKLTRACAALALAPAALSAALAPAAAVARGSSGGGDRGLTGRLARALAGRETLRTSLNNLSRMAEYGGAWEALLAAPHAAAGDLSPHAAADEQSSRSQQRPGTARSSAAAPHSPRHWVVLLERQRAQAAASRRLLRNMMGMCTVRGATACEPHGPRCGVLGGRRGTSAGPGSCVRDMQEGMQQQERRRRPQTAAGAGAAGAGGYDWAWIERACRRGSHFELPPAAECMTVRLCPAAAAASGRARGVRSAGGSARAPPHQPSGEAARQREGGGGRGQGAFGGLDELVRGSALTKAAAAAAAGGGSDEEGGRRPRARRVGRAGAVKLVPRLDLTNLQFV